MISSGQSRDRDIPILGNDSATAIDFRDTARTAPPTGLRRADFTELIAEETEKWRTITKFAGVKPKGGLTFHKSRSPHRYSAFGSHNPICGNVYSITMQTMTINT